MSSKFNLTEKSFVKVSVLLISFVVILVAIFGEKGLFDLYKLHQEEVGVKNRLQQLKLKEQEWLEKIAIFKMSKNSVDTLAREELGLIKKNEVLLMLPQKNRVDKK